MLVLGLEPDAALPTAPGLDALHWKFVVVCGRCVCVD